MSGRITERLRELGITLPSPSTPPAVYSPFHVWNGIVTGQVHKSEASTTRPQERFPLGSNFSTSTGLSGTSGTS
jgi:hypothetical protein